MAGPGGSRVQALLSGAVGASLSRCGSSAPLVLGFGGGFLTQGRSVLYLRPLSPLWKRRARAATIENF